MRSVVISKALTEPRRVSGGKEEKMSNHTLVGRDGWLYVRAEYDSFSEPRKK